MSALQREQSQIVFRMPARSCDVWEASYRGPHGAAARMWHASPVLTDFAGAEWGPTVGSAHSLLEQMYGARPATTCRTLAVNSSRPSPHS